MVRPSNPGGRRRSGISWRIRRGRLGSTRVASPATATVHAAAARDATFRKRRLELEVPVTQILWNSNSIDENRRLDSPPRKQVQVCPVSVPPHNDQTQSIPRISEGAAPSLFRPASVEPLLHEFDRADGGGFVGKIDAGSLHFGTIVIGNNPARTTGSQGLTQCWSLPCQSVVTSRTRRPL